MADGQRFRRIFQLLHQAHPACLQDEWLGRPCADARGRPLDRPVVWSRRNGPWRRHALLFVGAAPGNAGGRGAGELGAHGTRIPFGGDVAGANLDVLLGSIGSSRNDTFLTAALNQLPAAGGGEPTWAEVTASAGGYRNGLEPLRDTVLACGPRLVVALGNVALRALVAALQLEAAGPDRPPSLARIGKAGIARGKVSTWPAEFPPAEHFLRQWRAAWRRAPLPHLLLLTHPSAQNMSPFAGVETRFHARMIEARAALRAAVTALLGREPPTARPELPSTGIYALPEWRERIGPRHRQLDLLWREKGV